jgi:hypothetical protein
LKGKIIKGVAGFYYVHVPQEDKIYECKAKGVFRNQNIKPLVGDNVEIYTENQLEGTGVIVSILPRKNELKRPAVANVDQAMVIFAATEPDPNLNLLDRFLITMQKQNIDSIVCFNKKDIAAQDEIRLLMDTYANSGHKVICISVLLQDGCSEIFDLLKGKPRYWQVRPGWGNPP